MSMRNFWIEGIIDGRQEKLTGGPRAKEGGFDLTIYMRDNGESKRVLDIRGCANEDGTLELLIWPENPDSDMQYIMGHDLDQFNRIEFETKR
jgi:hypothetical protein